ncbi:MAG: hypothetical protein HOO91_11670 [Bacteroidales bacterium]|nr:hypothetical protein [Bacteroidales bacterium]
MESTKNEFNLNSTNLIQLVLSKRKLLMWIGAIAFVVSMVASFLITPMFKATAIIYPPINNQPSKELLTSNIQAGLTVFGDSKESEQLLQVLSSSTLRDIVIKKLNLTANWGIKSDDMYARHKTYGIYNDNIKFRPTQYLSVEVEVMDASPAMSAKIANTIVAVEDSLMLAIKAQVAKKGLLVVEEQYKLGLAEMKNLEDSLTKTMSNGVIHLQSQTQEFYRAYAKAVAKNETNAILALDKKMEPLKKYGGKYVIYMEEIQNKAIQITELSNSLKTMQIEASQKIPSQFVVDWASIPDKKDYPKKSIVIILSTLSALFFGIFLIVIADFIKNVLKGEK